MARVARRPLPEITPLTAPWWEAAAQGRLVIQYCPGCAVYLHPPEPLCPGCHGSSLEFRPVSGRGQVYASTTMTQPRVQGFEDYVPFSCVAVELAEQEGLLVLTNFVGDEGPEAEPAVGTPVEVVFETLTEDVALPQFRRARAS